MAWNDLSYGFQCSGCNSPLIFNPKEIWKTGEKEFKCPSCGNSMRLDDPPKPNLPSNLYIGPEKLRRIKLLPLPPKKVIYKGHGIFHSFYGSVDCGQCPFAMEFPSSYGAPMNCGFDIPDEIQPYSVRSFLIQLSLRKDFPCKYFVQTPKRDDFGNILWEEGCMESCDGYDYEEHSNPCNIANGWMHGEKSCSGWEHIKGLCQSENESRFLHQYLRMNKDREFPMPIPQAHIEITECIRVDFVMFVPITRVKWKWLAIEIDSKQYHQNLEKDFQKEITMASNGYEVMRLSAEKKMLDQVRELYTKVDNIQSAIKRNRR